ncbi:MAG: prephenate dehydratase domain-containing protein [Myxococcota bacterium]
MMTDDELLALRAALNDIDAGLVASLGERQRVVEQIGRLKTEGTAQLRDVTREEELLTRLVKLGGAAGLDRHYVTRIFQEVLEQSVRRQQEQLLGRDNPERAVAQSVVVGYLGSPGSYSHQAAARHFGGRDAPAVLRGGPTFAALVEGVRRGETDFAVLAIENTTAGSINEVYDLLDTEPVFIVGEEVQRVDHGLLALPDAEVASIRRIVGHPQALAQCSKFLRRMSHCVAEAVADTATGGRRVAEAGDPTLAAIGNAVTAREHDLQILWPGIANQADNLTRFVVVADRPLSCDDRIPCKTSLLFCTPHEHGALLRALNVFSQHGLNLTKLESRPKLGEAWNYRFYVDFLGKMSQETLARVVDDLSAFTTDLKNLGTYPAKTDHSPSTPRDGA